MMKLALGVACGLVGALDISVTCADSIDYRLNSVLDPDVNLTIGETVVFVIGVGCGSYPFQIAYNNGSVCTTDTTNNPPGGITNGNVTLVATSSTPPQLIYHCLSQPLMTGNIFVNPTVAPTQQPSTHVPTSRFPSLSPTLSTFSPTTISPSTLHPTTRTPTNSPPSSPTTTTIFPTPSLRPTTTTPSLAPTLAPTLSNASAVIAPTESAAMLFFSDTSDPIVIVVFVAMALFVCILCLAILFICKKKKKQRKQSRRLKELQARTEEIRKSANPLPFTKSNTEQELTASPASGKIVPLSKPTNLYLQSQKELQNLAMAIDTLTPSPNPPSPVVQTGEEPKTGMTRSSTTWLIESMMAELDEEAKRSDAPGSGGL